MLLLWGGKELCVYVQTFITCTRAEYWGIKISLALAGLLHGNPRMAVPGWQAQRSADEVMHRALFLPSGEQFMFLKKKKKMKQGAGTLILAFAVNI